MLQGAAGTLSLPWMRRGGEQRTVVGMSCGTSNSGNLKTSLGVVDFWAESGLGELRQIFLSLCLCCISNGEEGMGEALCCAEDCPDPW